jgi:hypothetical protein
MINPYVYEKLRELEDERFRKAAQLVQVETTKRTHRAIFGSLAGVTGRVLRRAGEGLESWAYPPPADCEGQRAQSGRG